MPSDALAARHLPTSGCRHPCASFRGVMADLPALTAAAPGVVMIEDAACALGASSRAVGECRFGGNCGVLSLFHPRKAVTTGEGWA